MKNIRLSLLVLALGLTGGLLTGFTSKADQRFTEKPKYLKSATYFSDDWVMNFWNSESSNLDAELRQIASDGFNSIILVVPWREFQPKTEPISYNSYAWDKLEKVMEAAERQGLWVTLRVGYTWDYYDQTDVLIRYQELLSKESTQKAWYSYVERLYQKASAHPNFYGGFLTWEDFWNLTEIAGSKGHGLDSIRMAKEIGFQRFVKSRYSLEELSRLYQVQINSYESVYLPARLQPAFQLFYEYYDTFLNKILKESQKVFPDLSMEVRLDVDPVSDGEGGLIGANHYSTYPCQDAPYTSVMYSVSMGQENNNEKIDAKAAVDRSVEYLDRVKLYNKGKAIYIDQFLYMDTTPEFSHNAQLHSEDKNEYLLSMIPVLKSKTMGYGVWTYRNYLDNVIYNAQFALDAKGWGMKNCEIVEKNGNKRVKLKGRGSDLYQNLGIRFLSKKRADIRVRFLAESDVPTTIMLSIGKVNKTIEVDGEQQFDIRFAFSDCSDIRFTADQTVYLDDISVSTYEQEGELYDVDGNELRCIEAIRTVNEQLK